MRRWIRLGAVAVSVALVAAACTKETDGTNGTEGGMVEGGIYRLGSPSTIDSLNPFVAFEQDAYNMFMQIYPFLVYYDENLEFTGDFADGWELAPDNTSITFATRSGGAWSDGDPLTADDVAYTLNLIVRFPGPTGLMAGYAKHITGAEATDENTVVVSYEQPINEGWALSQLLQIPILPEHVWSQHEGDDGKDLKRFTNADPTVSGGAFVLDNYEKRDIAQFSANPGFYGPEPHIDGYGLKFYTNTDAMISALQNGEIDAVETLPATAYDAVKANPDLVVLEGEGLNEDDFIINSNKPRHEELLDPAVRDAFAHAINYQEMVDTVLDGHGSPATTFVPPGSGEWHNANLEPIAYDIDEANRILDDAGYEMGPDGVRIANGHPMEYEVLTPNDVVGADREFQIIQGGFEQIGVKLSQKSLDPDALFVAIAGPTWVDYDGFDLAIWNWYMLQDPDFALSVLTCEQFGFWNDTGYCNEEYDALYEEQGVTVDQAARQEIVYRMQEIVYEDKPYIMLQYRDMLEAHSAEWEGFVFTPLGSYNNLTKLTLLNVHQVG